MLTPNFLVIFRVVPASKSPIGAVAPASRYFV